MSNQDKWHQDSAKMPITPMSNRNNWHRDSARMTRPIPKIIHQIYWDFKGGNRPMPQQWQEAHQKIIQLHPDWEVVLWDLDMATELVTERYPWFLPDWKKLQNIEKCDILRIFLMEKYGGVYADLDIIPIKPLDDFLDRSDVILTRVTLDPSWESLLTFTVNRGKERLISLNNCFMMSRPHHPFWMSFLHSHLKKSYLNVLPNYMRVMLGTGPGALSLHLKSFTHNYTQWKGIEPVSSEHFDAKITDPITEQTYIRHLGNVTWMSSVDRHEMILFGIVIIGLVILIVVLMWRIWQSLR